MNEAIAAYTCSPTLSPLVSCFLLLLACLCKTFSMLLEKYSEAQVLNSGTPRHVPVWRQCLNVLCCLFALPVYFILTVSTQYPITLDLLTAIILAELNRFINERRRQELYELEDRDESPIREKENPLKWELDVEKVAPRLDSMAAVVGWREDTDLFHRALSSYSVAQGCVFLLVGIDGDSPEDQDMVNVFNEVRKGFKQSIELGNRTDISIGVSQQLSSNPAR